MEDDFLRSDPFLRTNPLLRLAPLSFLREEDPTRQLKAKMAPKARFTGAARGRLRAPKPRVFPASGPAASTRPALPPRRALPADDATVSHLHHLLTLALEPLYMPCSGMKCGDIIYRSTLDPSLRLEERGVNPQLVALGAAALLYLFAKPGIFPGFVDYYFLAPAYSLLRKKVRQEEIVLGKVIGTGGFGKVYKAKLRSGGPEELVVKKAYDYGEAEVWMNERLERWERYDARPGGRPPTSFPRSTAPRF